MYSVTGEASSVPLRRPTLCGVCRYHQGGETEQLLEKHRDHEARLREALEVADQYARKTQSQVDNSRERVASALSSRDRAIAKLQAVNDLHVVGPSGACSCGVKRNCRTAEVLYDRWLQGMIGRADARGNDAP